MNFISFVLFLRTKDDFHNLRCSGQRKSGLGGSQAFPRGRTDVLRRHHVVVHHGVHQVMPLIASRHFQQKRHFLKDMEKISVSDPNPHGSALIFGRLNPDPGEQKDPQK
jgi:hypothetical protein